MTTEQETLSTRTTAKTEPETMPEEERELYNGFIYSLFEEWIDGTGTATEAEKREAQEVMMRFSTINGVKRESSFTLMFMGFRAGVAKGLELIQKMEQGSLEES